MDKVYPTTFLRNYAGSYHFA